MWRIIDTSKNKDRKHIGVQFHLPSSSFSPSCFFFTEGGKVMHRQKPWKTTLDQHQVHHSIYLIECKRQVYRILHVIVYLWLHVKILAAEDLCFCTLSISCRLFFTGLAIKCIPFRDNMFNIWKIATKRLWYIKAMSHRLVFRSGYNHKLQKWKEGPSSKMHEVYLRMMWVCERVCMCARGVSILLEVKKCQIQAGEWIATSPWLTEPKGGFSDCIWTPLI